MQPTVKISQLPKQTAPAITDKAPIVHGSETDYVLLSDLITLFFNNVPSGAIPGITGSYVISGMVWTADSVGVNRNASMTAGTIYINNRTIAISAVTARTFTASKDVYIDVLDNLDGTGTLVYTDNTNNAASPALAANSIRIGIIVTGATTIATTGSVNQGQEDKVLPIASSIPYQVTDSLGNLICKRDPDSTLLGQRRITSTLTPLNATSATQLTGLSVPVIVPTGRKVEVSMGGGYWVSGGAMNIGWRIYDGVVAVGPQIQETNETASAGSNVRPTNISSGVITPATTSKTYNAAYLVSTNAADLTANALLPVFLKVELK
jgi:hypothetical protein